MNNSKIIVSSILGFFLAGCSAGSALEPTDLTGTTEVLQGAPGQSAAGLVTLTLTSDVAEGLIFMREEEKLARDVYKALAAKWKLRVFSNIAQSEQRHMDAIKVLLTRYGLTDPAEKTAAGIFINKGLKDLYQQLLDKGSKSVKDAYEVGKLIEETDIADLDRHLAQLTTESDIRRVYSNLRQGSVQHLAAFTRFL